MQRTVIYREKVRNWSGEEVEKRLIKCTEISES